MWPDKSKKKESIKERKVRTKIIDEVELPMADMADRPAKSILVSHNHKRNHYIKRKPSTINVHIRPIVDAVLV